jgi:hypothetical protein
VKVIKPNLKKGKWSKEEDEILINWVKQNGPKNWSKLSTILISRSSKQIRDRWINNLNPTRESFVWTNEVEKQLLIGYLNYGSSWVNISKTIPNSTENMIKNRFYSMLRSCAAKYKSYLNFSNSESDGVSNNNKVDILKKTIKEENNFKFAKKETNNKNDYEIDNELDQFFNFEDNLLLCENNSSISKCQESMYTNNKTCNSNNKKEKMKYKRNNYNINYLLNFLSYLLEEKGININEFQKQNKKENILINSLEQELDYPANDTCLNNSNHDNKISNEHEKILNNFFNLLCDKLPDINEKTNQIKIKSSILLNLQLQILHKIFERLRNQLIQKIFEDFKLKIINNK